MRRFFIQCDTGEEVDSDTGDLVRFEDHAAEVSRLNNELTAALLERDALDCKCAALALLLYGNPLPHGNGV